MHRKRQEEVFGDTLFSIEGSSDDPTYAPFINATSAYPTIHIVGSDSQPVSDMSQFLRIVVSEADDRDELVQGVADLSRKLESAADELSKSEGNMEHAQALTSAVENISSTVQALSSELRVVEAMEKVNSVIGGGMDEEDETDEEDDAMTNLVAQCIGLEISNPFEGTPDGYGYEVSFC